MRKALRRTTSAVLGLALGLVLLGPIQAQRLAAAICGIDVDGVAEQLQYVGWSRSSVETVAQRWRDAGTTCSQFGWRGTYIDNYGRVTQVAIVAIDDNYNYTYFYLVYDAGQLESLQ